MTRKEITIEEYFKLKPCAVMNVETRKWVYNKYRVVRRGKSWDTLAFLFGESVLQVLFKNFLVKYPLNA